MALTYEDLAADPFYEDKRTQTFIEENVDKTREALVVIDNTPKVEPAKVTKLTDFLRNKIKDKTERVPLRLTLPKDKDGVTMGFAFVEFENKQAAEEAARRLNGFKMDRSHQFKTNLFSDWEKYQETDEPEDYKEPSLGMDKFCEENLYEYLCDDAAREQYFYRYAGQTPGKKTPEHQLEIHWNDYQVINATDQTDPRELVYQKPNWTQIFAKWSPLGTYLVTFSQKGINLWGGKDWTSMGQFPHAEVQIIDWSPKEKYLITWGSELIVWDVQLGKKIRRVQVPYTGPGAKRPFKWSHDEQFLAKQSEDNILLYDLDKGMKLIQPDKERVTTIYMPGVQTLEWSPTDNYFCYWVPEENNTPARVTLVELVVKKLSNGEKDVSFRNIAQRNLYRVQNIRMTWHPQGDFLACKVEKQKKSNQVVSAYELFRIRHKDRAVETIELPDQVIAFDFEPRGHRFALIHGPSDVKLSVSFYTMGGKGTGEVKLLGSFPQKQVNHMYWSPRGKYILLAGLKQPFNGKCLEFWNVDELDLIQTVEHFMCSNVQWDASGRFLVTYVSHLWHQMENSFKIWTFQGRQVLHKKIDKFYQFEWRPRPQSLLTDKDLKNLKTKGKPTWEKKYSEEETWILEKDDRERRERLTGELNAYKSRLAEIKKTYAEHAKRRNELLVKSGVDFSYTTTTVQVEELVDRKEEKIQSRQD